MQEYVEKAYHNREYPKDYTQNLMSYTIKSNQSQVMNICISTTPSLVQITACHLFHAKPLSKPTLILVNKFHWNFKKISARWQSFWLGLGVLKHGHIEQGSQACPCSNSDRILSKLLLMWGHGWVITSYIKQWMQLLIHGFISVYLCQ